MTNFKVGDHVKRTSKGGHVSGKKIKAIIRILMIKKIPTAPGRMNRNMRSKVIHQIILPHIKGAHFRKFNVGASTKKHAFLKCGN